MHAQVIVKTEIDSTEILIGQQAHITLKVTADTKDKITMPVFPQKFLTKGIEVLNENVIATKNMNEGKRISVTKQYTITSFDSSFYYIPPFKIKVGSQVYTSKSLALKVESMVIDTLHVDRFFGPKGIAEVPFSWKDWRGLFLLTLLLILLFTFAGYVALQLYNKRPLLKNIRLRPVLPPHLWAMKEIEKLNGQKKKVNDSKQYYSELTDVLRSYIQRRYGFNALEMTSTEIIGKLIEGQTKESVTELRELFHTADMAKFAKLQTLLNENDENLLRAMKFINATKVEETMQPMPKKVVSPEVVRSDRYRALLIFIVVIALVLSVGILIKVGINISEFLL